jgi:hypothetical protein
MSGADVLKFMKKLLILLLGVSFCLEHSGRAAQVIVGEWSPLFAGVDLASGQQVAEVSGERNQRVLCLRIDLLQPDIKLFTTPKCTNCGNFETLAQTPSRFLEQNDLQVAINGGFYSSSLGPNDVPEGTPEDVLGLAISRGVMVSPPNNAAHVASLLFTESNQAFFIPTNSPPTNTTGIYTAISGNRALLVNGVNINDPDPSDVEPRTCLGISADRRYLFLLTLDGRQPGWSEGADYHSLGEWLLRFGASDGMNVDGGGSTTMVMEDCGGFSQRLNRSSFVAAYGRERIIGHNFGVHAARLSTGGPTTTVTPGTTTALLTWRTAFPGNTRVEYGSTTNYGRTTPLDAVLTYNHVATLSGLEQGSNYFFRVTSEGDNGERFTEACRFVTQRNFTTTQVFGLTQSWRYTTNNLDSVNWRTLAYDDSGWMGPGPALLYALETSPSVAPRLTEMPPAIAPAPRTYYFRTRFDYTGSTAGLTLTFSNYVDDGAVFHLNGMEVRRLRMPAAPQTINNASTAIGSPCGGTPQNGDAATICPDVFTITNPPLVQGENVMAVSVHNLPSGNDIVFGCALLQNASRVTAPQLQVSVEGARVTLYWNAEGFTLQEATDLSAAEPWSDVTGPVTASPYHAAPEGTRFYRLRN